MARVAGAVVGSDAVGGAVSAGQQGDGRRCWFRFGR